MPICIKMKPFFFNNDFDKIHFMVLNKKINQIKDKNKITSNPCFNRSVQCIYMYNTQRHCFCAILNFYRMTQFSCMIPVIVTECPSSYCDVDQRVK